jgi:orotidine-5'-phosphate decarboxylase
MLKRPLFVALDVDSEKEAHRIVELTAPYVGGFKVGPRLVLRYGPHFVTELAARAPVFLDNKYFDIPNTMESAIKASFEIGASFATIHAQAGPEAMSRLAKLEKELNQIREFKILAVTVLTSFTAATLPKVLKEMPIQEQVLSLAKQVIESGLTGLVCSPEEVALMRKTFPDSYLVIPGIRMKGSDLGDQKRIADPLSALTNGASALVVGRPIVEAENPAQAAKQYADVTATPR